MSPPIIGRSGARAARRPPGSRGRSSTGAARSRRVFLNVPFDDIDGYEDCFLAYVAGLVGLGLQPHSVLEVPSGGHDRLTRIFRLMRQCRYSIHDLTRIQLRAGRYPRFNMPFEAGMATALSLAALPAHDRYVFATRERVVQNVASDLGGVEVYEHRGRARGVMAALRNAFVRREQSTRLDDRAAVHRALREWADVNCRRARRSLYEPAMFKDLVLFATALWRQARRRRRSP